MSVKAIPRSRDSFFNDALVSDRSTAPTQAYAAFPATSRMYENSRILCPHCSREVTRRDIMLLEDNAAFLDLIQWTIPCPNCARMIVNFEPKTQYSRHHNVTVQPVRRR